MKELEWLKSRSASKKPALLLVEPNRAFVNRGVNPGVWNRPGLL